MVTVHFVIYKDEDGEFYFQIEDTKDVIYVRSARTWKSRSSCFQSAKRLHDRLQGRFNVARRP